VRRWSDHAKRRSTRRSLLPITGDTILSTNGAYDFDSSHVSDNYFVFCFLLAPFNGVGDCGPLARPAICMQVRRST